MFKLSGGFFILISLIVLTGEGSKPLRSQTLTLIWAQTAIPAASPAPAPTAVSPPLGVNPPTKVATRSSRDSPLSALLGNKWIATTTGILLFLVLAYPVVLWKCPLWLLHLSDDGLEIPIGSGNTWRVGSGQVQFLKYRQRVLDAWVEDHQVRIQQRFLALATVEQRRHHLSLPVKVNQKLESELTPERLKDLGADSCLVLISGEGGVGKTSLALRIAGWALAGKLTDRPAVPVLVEADLQGEESLLSRVRSTLVGLSEHKGPESAALVPTLPLVRALLERRRLLLILDHFSELGDESRRRLLPTADDFPSAWAIVTSRREENFGGKVVLHLRPQRLTADQLWPFFTDYLRLVEAEEALDFDLHERAVSRLREITAGIVDEKQAITVLLAKLYIDVVLAERRGAGGSLLPASVPALMLTYVRQINGGIPEAERQPKELVVRALQHLAQASEERLFRPLAVRREVALRALARASAEREGIEAEEGSLHPRGGLELLRYLVDRLLLVEESPDGEALRLVLDPLADYLAALGWLRQLDHEGEGSWEGFLGQTLPTKGSERATLAQGFLRAMYDSAVHAADPAVLGLVIEPQLLGRLAERASIDPQRIAQERDRRRLRRLIDDLAEPDLAVRLHAIEELCRRRSREAIVMTALGSVLNSEQQDQEVRQAAAIALAAQGGVTAARSLAERVHTPLHVGADHIGAVALRRIVLEGLGLAAAGLQGAGESQSGERQRFMQVLELQLRADAIDIHVESAEGWAKLDRRLGVLQGASRGLQLAASAELPLLGSGPGCVVPMLTLTAIKVGEGLRVRTEVVEPAVWKLPLPGVEQLEMVLVPGGEYEIGSPESEAGRDIYPRFRPRCEGVNVEAHRTVRLEPYAMTRFPISQAQWAAVAGLPLILQEIASSPGTYEARGLWECYAQPGGLAVDSVSWFDCGEWLARLNHWLVDQWAALEGTAVPPKLALPSESQWEVACRAGTTTPFHGGDTLDPSWANYDANNTYGRGRKGEYRQRPMATGALAVANRWGLSEMHGQQFEWCGDRWHPDPIGAGWRQDGSAWAEHDSALEGLQDQDFRLLRGGSWLGGPHDCRAACRLSNHPVNDRAYIGFRPCCLLPPGSLLDS